ncbi:MAG: hypothetical protein HXY20_15380 [Acidobacteria bacterium]|nr:hypothetical protein [Acidobacteriota bacterium]
MKQHSLSVLFLLLVITIVSIPHPASAQRMFLRRPFEKGSLIGSGGFSFSSSGGSLYVEDGKRQTQLSLNPSLAYFVTRGLAVGIQTSISYVSRGDQSFTSLGAGPEVSLYLRKRESNPKAPIAKGSLVPYISAGLAFISSNGSSPTWGEYKYKSTGTNLSLGAGCLYMMSLHYAVFLRASYEFHRRSNANADAQTGNRIILSAGLSLFAL